MSKIARIRGGKAANAPQTTGHKAPTSIINRVKDRTEIGIKGNATEITVEGTPPTEAIPRIPKTESVSTITRTIPPTKKNVLVATEQTMQQKIARLVSNADVWDTFGAIAVVGPRI